MNNDFFIHRYIKYNQENLNYFVFKKNLTNMFFSKNDLRLSQIPIYHLVIFKVREIICKYLFRPLIFIKAITHNGSERIRRKTF